MINVNDQRSIEKGSDAWNVAQGYTTLKILKPLVEIDKLVRIAIYGCEHIEESINLPEHIKPYRRLEGILRIIDILIETIENSYFAMTVKGTKEGLNVLMKRVEDVQSVIEGIKKIETDSRNQSSRMVINEEHFNVCLKELRSIKKEMPDLLNKNSLIFPTSEEVDLDKIKNQFIYGG